MTYVLSLVDVAETLLKQINDEKFRSLWKVFFIQEAKRTASYLNRNRASAKRIVIKQSEIDDKEGILRAARETRP